MRVSVPAALLIATLLMASATCGTDPPAGRYPPSAYRMLKEIFDPKLAALGLTLTRASLIDRSTATYAPSTTGTHLALYVEPKVFEGWTTDDYVSAIAPTVAATAPFAFGEWAALQSFDICQEPTTADEPGKDPPIVTQFELSRADSARIDWPMADLTALLTAAARSPETARLLVDPAVGANTAYRRALASALADGQPE